MRLADYMKEIDACDSEILKDHAKDLLKRLHHELTATVQVSGVEKHHYSATYDGSRVKRGQRFVLLLNIDREGEPFRDHAWVASTLALSQLKKGDKIKFVAAEQEYVGADGNKKTGLYNVKEVTKVVKHYAPQNGDMQIRLDNRWLAIENLDHLDMACKNFKRLKGFSPDAG